MTTTDSKVGFDAPRDTKDDLLGRRPFASSVAKLAVDAPTDWSVRIGVYGPWGSGKSTILRMVQESVSARGFASIELNAWKHKDAEDLWLEFAERALAVLPQSAAAERRALLARRAATLSQRFLKAGKVVADAGGLAPVAAVAGMMESAASLVPAGLRYFDSSKDASRDRVVVLVDDLDRAAPDIIPSILWGLKEVFDLPGFSFVLFLDPDVVGSALGASHPGWGDGRLFLQKIVDFPRSIQSVTQTAAVRVVVAEVASLDLNIPVHAIEGLKDLLPPNPRQLRLFGRHLKVIAEEVERHGDRVDWPTMLRCALLDLEFPQLSQALLASRDEIRSLRVRLLASGQRDSEEISRRNEEAIERLCQSVGIDQPLVMARAKRLTDATLERDRSWTGLSALEQLGLILEPPLVAPRDVATLRAGWTSSLADWVVPVARARGASVADVELALLRELFVAYADAARQGLHADAAHVAAQQMIDATRLLALLEECAARIVTDDAVRVSAFAAAWNSLFGFIGVADAHQSTLRLREQALLTLLATATGSTAIDLLEYMQPWRSSAVDPRDSDARRTFFLSLQERLAAHASVALLTVLDQHPVDEARLRSGTSVESFLMMRISSPFWTTHRPDVVARLEAGSRVWQQTALTTLDLLFGEHAPRRGEGSPAKDREALAHLWRAAMSSPLNTRAFPKAERIREALSADGVVVAEPRWWDSLHADWRRLAARTQPPPEQVAPAAATATSGGPESGGSDA